MRKRLRTSILPRPVADARTRAEDWLTAERHGLRALAALRIALGVSVLGLLVSNFGNRQTWVGEGSVWAEPLRNAGRFPEVVLLDGVSGDLLTLVYVAVALAALAFTIGRWTKAANVVTLIGFIAITGQNPVLSEPADGLVRIVLLWMVLVRSSTVWSWDSTHDRRDDDAVPSWLGIGLHNVGLVGLSAQVALVYLAAGLDKVADPAWQRGTALYSTFQLPEYRVFPWLADLISGSTLLLGLITWTVLFVQLFFVPLLLHRVTRGIVVGLSVALNVFFAIVLAQVLTSLVLIGVTALFASDQSLGRLGDRVAGSGIGSATGWWNAGTSSPIAPMPCGSGWERPSSTGSRSSSFDAEIPASSSTRRAGPRRVRTHLCWQKKEFDDWSGTNSEHARCVFQ